MTVKQAFEWNRKIRPEWKFKKGIVAGTDLKLTIIIKNAILPPIQLIDKLEKRITRDSSSDA